MTQYTAKTLEELLQKAAEDNEIHVLEQVDEYCYSLQLSEIF